MVGLMALLLEGIFPTFASFFAHSVHGRAAAGYALTFCGNLHLPRFILHTPSKTFLFLF
jgi:hypothetical protein